MPLPQLEGRCAGGGIGQRKPGKPQRFQLRVKVSLRRQVGVGLGQRFIIAQQRPRRPGTDADKCPVPIHRAHDLIAQPGKQRVGAVLHLNFRQVVQRSLMRQGDIQLPRRGIPRPGDDHGAGLLQGDGLIPQCQPQQLNRHVAPPSRPFLAPDIPAYGIPPGFSVPRRNGACPKGTPHFF